MKSTCIITGERIEIEISRTGPTTIQAEVAERQYTLDAKAVQPGVYWFNWNNRSIEVSVTPNAEGYIVSVGGQRVTVEVVDARTALRKAAHHGHEGTIELRAPMPGKVVKVLVVEGDEVEASQGILVMEAMKMQNEIKSPKKGTVKRVSVIQGAAVNAGDLLAIVE